MQTKTIVALAVAAYAIEVGMVLGCVYMVVKVARIAWGG
jgi:hypothetical protein